MADRSVVVTLRANVAGYMSSMSAAAKSTADFGKSTVESAAKHKQSWDMVGKGMLVGGAVIAAGIALAVVSAAEFDHKMSAVKANIDDKTAPSMRRLADAALTAGKMTMFSAGQAADAENELAKAGLTAAQITGGALTAALSLASAGQIDLAAAAEITASTMVQFGLKAADAGHIADVLAAGADKSLGGVTDLAEGLKYAGVPAAQFGVSLDTTVGVLAEFASNGILGSMAGTSLRMMLIRLASPTSEAKDEMKALGLSFFNAKGDFVGVADMAGQLHTKLAGLTQQQREQTLVTLFGARSLSEANILYRDGAAGVDKWTKAVNDQGFAALQAATKMDNLSGDVTKLKTTFNVMFVEAGQGAQGPLRSLTQEFTNVLNAVASIPEPVMNAGLVLAGVAATALIGVGTFMTMAVKVGELSRAFKELAIASKLAQISTPVGIALAAITLAIGIFAKSEMDAAGRSKELADSLDKTTGAVTEQTLALIANRMQLDGTVELAKRAGVSMNTVVLAASGNTQAITEMKNAQDLATLSAKSALGAATAQGIGYDTLTGQTNIFALAAVGSVNQSNLQSGAMDKLMTNITGVNKELAPLTASQKLAGEAADMAATAAGGQTAAQKLNASAMADQAKAADDATKANDALVKSMEAYGALLAGQRDAVRGFYSAVDAASAALKANGKTLDVTTQKGRDNQAALDAISTSTLKMVAETFKNRDANTSLGTSVDAATKQILKGRDAFIASAHSMGMSVPQAKKLADQLGLTKDNAQSLGDTITAIPGVKDTKVTADTSSAAAKLAAFDKAAVAATRNRAMAVRADISQAVAAVSTLQGYLARLHSRGIVLTAAQQGSANKLLGMGKAGGGYIDGFGTSTSDSNLTPTSRGEYVVKAASVAQVGRGFMDQVNSGRVPITSRAEGSTFNTTINEVTDPVGTSQAVNRRLAMLGAT